MHDGSSGQSRLVNKPRCCCCCECDSKDGRNRNPAKFWIATVPLISIACLTRSSSCGRASPAAGSLTNQGNDCVQRLCCYHLLLVSRLPLEPSRYIYNSVTAHHSSIPVDDDEDPLLLGEENDERRQPSLLRGLVHLHSRKGPFIGLRKGEINVDDGLRVLYKRVKLKPRLRTTMTPSRRWEWVNCQRFKEPRYEDDDQQDGAKEEDWRRVRSRGTPSEQVKDEVASEKSQADEDEENHTICRVSLATSASLTKNDNGHAWFTRPSIFSLCVDPHTQNARDEEAERRSPTSADHSSQDTKDD